MEFEYDEVEENDQSCDLNNSQQQQQQDSEEEVEHLEKVELRYGNIISLSFYELNNCVLTASGFLNAKVQAEKVTYSNQDRALFMLYPSFNLNNLNKLEKISMMSNKEKKSFQKRVIEDYKQNIDIFMKMKGMPILFDQPIQLLNININKFLSCNYKEAEEEKQNFKLDLQEFSSKNTLFKILPSFIHQDKKDAVVLSSDIIMLVSAERYLGRDPYIHCNFEKLKNQIQIQKLISIDNSNDNNANNQLKRLATTIQPMTNKLLNEQAKYQTDQDGFKQNQKNENHHEDIFQHCGTTVTEQINPQEEFQFKNFQKKQYNPQQEFQEQPQEQLIKQKDEVGSSELSSIVTPIDRIESNGFLLKDYSEDSQDQNNNQLFKHKMNQMVPCQPPQSKHQVEERNNSHYNNPPKIINTSNLGQQLQIQQASQLQVQQASQLHVQNYQPSSYLPSQPSILNPLNLLNQKAMQQQLAGLKEIAIQNENVDIIEVNVSLEDKTKWVIKCYQGVIQDEDIVCYGDKLWLHHLETGNNLVTYRNVKEEKQQIKFEPNTATRDSSFLTYNGNTNGMWVIQRNQKLKGGYTEFNQIIYLKHYSLNKYLSLMKFHCANGENAYYFHLIDQPNHNSQFMFMKLPSSGSKNQKYVTKDSFFYLKSVEYRLFVNISFRKTNTHLEEYLGYNQGVDVSSSPHDEAAFKLYRSTHSESLETFFLIQCYPILTSSINRFKILNYQNTVIQNNNSAHKQFLQISTVDRLQIMQLQYVIRWLDKFCNNTIVFTQLDNIRNFNKVSYHRQKIIKEQQIIESLILIIQLIVTENDLIRIRDQKIYRLYQNTKLQFSNKTIININKVKNAIEKQTGINLNESIIKLGEMELKQGHGGHAFLFAINKMDEDRVQTNEQYQTDKIEILKSIYLLLTKICSDNTDNQNIVYNQLISFQNHAAYIKEAADFVISIVSQNETILSNLSDDIKIAYENEIQENPSPLGITRSKASATKTPLTNGKSPLTGVGNKNKRYSIMQQREKKNTDIEKSVNKQQTKNSLPDNQINNAQVQNNNNLILFFKENAIEQYKQNEKRASFNLHAKDLNVMNFFRNICKFQGKGVSVNQEQIHKFCFLGDSKTDFHKSLFYKVQGEEKGLKVELHGKKIYIGNQKPLQQNFSMLQSRPLLVEEQPLSTEIYNYLIEQIYFCSDLCLSRNYLWKKDLKSDFPVEFVFKIIFDSQVDEKLRSAFCNLALSLYIDHEPLNLKQVPNMCRIFRLDEIKNAANLAPRESLNDNNIEESLIYRFTIQKIIKYINQQYNSIKKKKRQFLQNQNQPDNQDDKSQKSPEYQEDDKDSQGNQKKDSSELLDNVLTLDIIKMLCTFVRFDILTIINEQNMYKSIVTTLIQLLEYDKQNNNYSYVIHKVRQDRYTNNLNSLNKKGKLLSNLGGFIMSGALTLAKAGQEMAGGIAGMVKNIMGIQFDKSKDSEDEDDQIEFSNTHYNMNPMIGGLVTLKTMLQTQATKEEHQISVDIKIEICQLLIFQQNLRMDYLLSNYLAWFDTISKKYSLFNQKKIIAEIEDEIPTILPEIYLTGIDSIEQKIAEMNDPKSDSLENLTNILSFKKRKKFNNYLGESEYIPNLDSLLQGDQEQNQQSQQTIQKSKTNPNQSDKQNGNTNNNNNNNNESNQVKQEVLPSLLCGLFLSKNHQVEDSIISVLRNCFNQSNILFQNLYQLEVLFDNKDIIPYQLLRNNISKLRQYAEESEIWLTDFLRTKQAPEKMRQTQQVLSEINELFYFDVKIVDNQVIIPDMSESQHSLNTGCKERKIDNVRQKVFTFLMGHFSLINLVRDSQNQMAKLLRSDSVTIKAKSVIHQLLSSLYRCLTLYCDNYEDNQNILSKYTSFFLDEIELDFGQLELVCSIYKNNKFLCETFPDNLATFLTNNIVAIGRQPRFLSLFKIILTYKDSKNKVINHLSENQIKVIQWFLPKDISDKQEIATFSHLLFANINTQNKLQISFNLQMTQQQNELQKQQGITSKRDLPYYYHGELLDLFIQSIKGDESQSINISKLKRVLSQSYMFDLLLLHDSFLPASESEDNHRNNNEDLQDIILQLPLHKKKQKQPLIDFSDNYVVTEDGEGMKILKPKIIDFMMAVFMNEDKPVTDSIKDHKRFGQLFEMEMQRLSSNIDQFPFDYIEYICGKFLRIGLFYLKKIIIRDHQQEYKDIYEYNLLYEISKLLFNLRFQFDEMLPKPIFQLYHDFMKEVNQEYYEQYSCEIQAALKQPEIQNTNFTNTMQRAQYNWKTFLSICRNSQTTKDNIDQEMSVLAQSIIKIRDIFPAADIKQFKIDIEYQQLIKKLISYLQFGISNKANHENMIFVFSLLTQIMIDEENNVNDDESGNNNQESDEKLEAIQNILDQQDATKMCLHLLSDSKSNPIENKHLLNALLTFFIKLTEGGNKQIQKTIYEYMITYPKSEVIFQLFHSIISQFIEDLKENKKIELMKIQKSIIKSLEQQSSTLSQSNQQEFKVARSHSRNHSENIPLMEMSKGPKKLTESNKLETAHQDYQEQNDQNENVQMEFDEEKDSFRKQQEMINSNILMGVLRVLQLFCEGHNLELQNYIRYQRNSRNNYDMVSIIIELLLIFYDNINDDIFENMIKCLDTLIEFVQGPCKMNQETIIDSKFFQFAEDILSGDNHKQSDNQALNDLKLPLKSGDAKASFSKQRSMKKTKTIINQYASQFAPPPLQQWMLEQIKYKTMVLVTSLMELNSEPLVVKRIMRSLPLEILKKNLISIFKKHKDLYQDQYIIQCFGHFDGEPEDESEKELKHYTYIIETGFFIFFLLSYYTELDENDLDADISSKLNEIKNDFKDSKQMFSLRKGIIAQLYNFVYAIIGGVLSIIYELTNKIGNQLKTFANPESVEIDIEQQIKIDNDTFKEGLGFFNRHSGSIEIVRENKLEKIRFIMLPFCHYLPKQNKVEFHDSVDRDSTHSKLSCLVEQSKDIIEICKHEEQLYLFFNRNKFIGIFANSVDLWRDIAFLLTILINVLIILSYGNGDGNDPRHTRLWLPSLGVHNEVTVETTKTIFLGTGIVIIICSTFVVLFFLCKRGPLYLKRAWEENSSFISDKNQTKLIIYTKYLVIILSSVLKVLMNPEVIYYLMCGTLAFIATLFHPFLFAFHLTEFLIRFPTLRNILKSVSDSFVSLVLTFVLIIMLFYFQAVIGFITFYSDYNEECNQLYLCVFHTFTMTFQNNGGIGGYLYNNTSSILEDGKSYNFGRFFYDNISFFSVMLISVQIFAGVIIDKFSSLREREHEKNTDIFQTCFVCGHSRELFERQSDVGFDAHIRQDHYLWNYLFYIAFINWKEKTDHTGIESFVYQKLDDGDHSWFPISRAIVLKDHSEEDQEDIIRRKNFKIESQNFNKIIGEVHQSQKLLQEFLSAKKGKSIS